MQDLVDPVQLGHLLTQPAVLLGHLGAGPIMTFTRVGPSLPGPVPECLVMHVQLLHQMPDRRLRADSRYRRSARALSSSGCFSADLVLVLFQRNGSQRWL